MKSKTLILLLAIIVGSCSNSVEYSETFKKETSGKYLFNQDDVIKVYYENNTLLLKWREGLMTPVALDTNEFFVADMYKKLHFVQHPETKARYLSIMSEGDDAIITYDYLKVPDAYKTPSTYLKEGNYEKALAGFLDIKEKDSTSIFIAEREFNNMGYQHLRKNEYAAAIEVFKLNVALHPTSDNVYDSLAAAYVKSGDSLQAFTYYTKALELNTGNKRAKAYLEGYNKTQD